jgi:hypothetical protein
MQRFGNRVAMNQNLPAMPRTARKPSSRAVALTVLRMSPSTS